MPNVISGHTNNNKNANCGAYTKAYASTYKLFLGVLDPSTQEYNKRNKTS